MIKIIQTSEIQKEDNLRLKTIKKIYFLGILIKQEESYNTIKSN